MAQISLPVLKNQFVAGATEVWATEPTALWNPVTPEMMRNDKFKFLEFPLLQYKQTWLVHLVAWAILLYYRTINDC